MGVEGLEPSRPFTVNGFSSSRSFRYCLLVGNYFPDFEIPGFENWTLPLPSALTVRVAPVGPLHLLELNVGTNPRISSLAQDCHARSMNPQRIHNLGLGFPEFESFHLKDFSLKAQFSKSVASTIPPHPQN